MPRKKEINIQYSTCKQSLCYSIFKWPQKILKADGALILPGFILFSLPYLTICLLSICWSSPKLTNSLIQHCHCLSPSDRLLLRKDFLQFHLCLKRQPAEHSCESQEVCLKFEASWGKEQIFWKLCSQNTVCECTYKKEMGYFWSAMTQDSLNHLISYGSDLLSDVLRLCSTSEVVGQKKGAKQKLNCKEYILKWKKRIDTYKDGAWELMSRWDCHNFCSENCFCYNMYHKIQFSKRAAAIGLFASFSSPLCRILPKEQCVH